MPLSPNTIIYHHISGVTRQYEQCHHQLYDQEGTPVWHNRTTTIEWKTSPHSRWMLPFRHTISAITLFLAYIPILIVSILLLASMQWAPLIVFLLLNAPLWYNRNLIRAYRRLQGPEALKSHQTIGLIAQTVTTIALGTIWGLTSWLLENHHFFWLIWGLFTLTPTLIMWYMRYQLRYTKDEQ